jgi:hypothetical protein
MKYSLTPFYAILRDLQVNNVRRPQDFETAVKDKEAAKENIKVWGLINFFIEENIDEFRLRKMNDRNY